MVAQAHIGMGRSAPMVGETLEDGDGVVAAVQGSILVVGLSGRLGGRGMARVVAAAQAVQRRARRFGCMIVVDASTREIARSAVALAREHAALLVDRSFGVAVVVQGGAAFQLFARSIAAGAQLAAQPRAPWRVFSDDEMVDAVAWLARTAHDVDAACDPRALVEAMRIVCARRADAEAALADALADELADEMRGDDLSGRAPSEVSWSDTTTLDTVGRFHLVESLAQGGMARAFRALHRGPGAFEKSLVVKMMREELAADPGFRAMFLREARLAAALPSHANVVQVFEAGEDGGRPYIAMELLHGLTAFDLAQRAWASHGSVPVEILASIAADAARGLHHAHTNKASSGGPLVHRDVTPDNLMVTDDGTTKVLDFGIARANSDEQSAAGVLKGKLPLMSPEQVAGRPLDGRSDLYALGVTLYWLASGMFPFYEGGDAALIRRILLEPAPPLRSIAPHVPEAFASIVDNLLRKTPADRVGNGRQLAAAIEHAVPVQRERVVEYMERMRACPAPRDDHTGTVLLPQPTLEAQP